MEPWAVRVGEAILIFDPKLPVPGEGMWYLWDERHNEPRRYDSRLVSESGQKLGGNEAERVLEAYGRWSLSEKAGWLAHLPPASRPASRSTLKARLRRSGRYSAHCWRCEASVDSSADPRCPRCGWVTCRKCTACGCEWNL